MSIRIVFVDPDQRSRYQERIAALEKLATYPLGDDTFQIDHGEDYFAFFDRMGDVLYAVVLDGEQVIAVGAGVLRRVAYRRGDRPRKAWYLCDLKVHPDHRGSHVPLRMLRFGFCPHYLRCRQGYGITMNPPGDRPNRVVRLVRHWRWSPVRVAGTLNIYSLDADAARRVTELIASFRGAVSWYSPRGIKDIVLGSTGQPMPLLHGQYDVDSAGVTEPQPDHVHMVCAMQGEALAEGLGAAGIEPSATATVLAHGMKRADWSFVLTSEI